MKNSLQDFLQLLRRLDAAKIFYRLSSSRSDAVAIEVDVPGERWEIEFMEDGSVEIERFKSDGTIHDESALTELFSRYGETDERD